MSMFSAELSRSIRLTGNSQKLIHRKYITYRESAMEKVAQQILNAHREWKPATVWHSLLSAGESGHDEHGWP